MYPSRRPRATSLRCHSPAHIAPSPSTAYPPLFNGTSSDQHTRPHSPSLARIPFSNSMLYTSRQVSLHTFIWHTLTRPDVVFCLRDPRRNALTPPFSRPKILNSPSIDDEALSSSGPDNLGILGRPDLYAFIHLIYYKSVPSPSHPPPPKKKNPSDTYPRNQLHAQPSSPHPFPAA